MQDYFWLKEKSFLDRKGNDVRHTRIADLCTEKFDYYEITYLGVDDVTVHGSYFRPKKVTRYPMYIFYPDLDCEFDYDNLSFWANKGIGVLTFQIKGQRGKTEDISTYSSFSEGHYSIRGILDYKNYYYKGVFLESMRLIDLVARLDGHVDKNNIIVDGYNQGGLLSLFASAYDDRIRVCISENPMFTNVKSVVENSLGIGKYISELINENPGNKKEILDTLSYYDPLRFVDEINAETLYITSRNEELNKYSNFEKIIDKLSCKFEHIELNDETNRNEVKYDFLKKNRLIR